MGQNNAHPALEERFLEPPGWHWSYFERGGRRPRYGFVLPQNAPPKAIVVCLSGLSEFAEKYFETARDLLAQNYAFWIIDWMGQGLSGRYLPDPHKRHSLGFQADVNDLHHLIQQHIKPNSEPSIPMVMLAHSMGGNIGLRYLIEYPDIFKCAAFSAPMLGIKAISHIPVALQKSLLSTLSTFLSKSYTPGGGVWQIDIRANPGRDAFSSDAVRGAVHNAWCNFNPELQVGSVTYGWLYEAVKSCLFLKSPARLRAIQTHCLLACAGRDMLVDNKALRHAANLIPDAKSLELPDAQHEILMEADGIRGIFMDAFYQLILENLDK